MKIEQLQWLISLKSMDCYKVEYDDTSLGCEQMAIADCESFSYGYTYQRLCIMACLVICYTMTILTGVFHCIAYAQVVIGICMLSIGVLFAFAKAPVVLVLLLGIFLTIICLLLTMSLITVVGRIVGPPFRAMPLKGLLVHMRCRYHLDRHKIFRHTTILKDPVCGMGLLVCWRRTKTT